MSARRMHGYVEVTIAAALLLDDNTLLHGDMADVTLAFGLPTRQPGRELTEAESKETLRLNLGRIAAVIETGLLANGAEHMGQIEEPMTEHSHEVGYTRSDPVTVRVEFRGEARA